MSLRQKLLLLLASARIANLPSVVSNVWLGVALGSLAGWRWAPSASLWPAAAVLALSGGLLYVSGNFLNDWHDRQWDAQHRPERACRALLPLLFFIEWPLSCAKPNLAYPLAETRIEVAVIAPHALALLFYVAGLSWIARCESKAAPPAASRVQARFLLLLSGLLMASWYAFTTPRFAVLGLLPFGVWLTLCFSRFGKSPRTQVSALLAGLPLLDWVALLPVSLSLFTHGRGGPLAVACLLLPPLAFLAGRGLQRLAAAT